MIFDMMMSPPAHLAACDDNIADIPVLPVPAPLTGCRQYGDDVAMTCGDDVPGHGSPQDCRYR